MWRPIFFVGIAVTWTAVQAVNATENANQNKTKRGLAEQTHYYGDPGLVKYAQTPVFHDSSASAATQPGGALNYYSNNQRPVLFQNHVVKPGAENEPPKQVTVQQVLYEYQQTPHNAVSNVHVNQQFQTTPVTVSDQRPYVPDTVQAQTSYPANPHFVNQHHILQVEPNHFSGVAAPVQHGAVINHGQGLQGFSKLFYNPYPVVPTTISPLIQNNAQPRYIYANGKILYHPAQTSTVYGSRPQNLLANIAGFQQRLPVTSQRPFKPSPLIPFTYGNQQVHPIVTAKPTQAPVKEDVVEEEEEDKSSDVREEHDEEVESDDHSNYEEEDEDEDKPAYYSKYRYEDDDDDHENYREQEEEEDDDNTRSYSRQIRKKPKSKPSKRYKKNDYYKYREGYEMNKKYSTKYKTPKDHYKAESSDRKPKTEYKSFKYSKSSNGKPRKEVIEGHQSQNVPVVHNKKVIRQEKWVVTKKSATE